MKNGILFVVLIMNEILPKLGSELKTKAAKSSPLKPLKAGVSCRSLLVTHITVTTPGARVTTHWSQPGSGPSVIATLGGGAL